MAQLADRNIICFVTFFCSFKADDPAAFAVLHVYFKALHFHALQGLFYAKTKLLASANNNILSRAFMGLIVGLISK